MGSGGRSDFFGILGIVSRREKQSRRWRATRCVLSASFAHLFTVLTHMRPYLTQCYEREGFPRTNNEMEQTIHALKAHYRRISGRKSWNAYLLRYGGCVAYREWWVHQPDGEALLQDRLRRVPTASWQAVRQQTRQSHQVQLNRFRFRQQPVHYLAALEQRWEQTLRT